MKKLLLALFPFFSLAQTHCGYWQQRVHYTMNIDMDADAHQFSGTQKLVYYNNSPDTLRQVFYHLYFNAFQPGSMMDERSRDLPDPDRRVGDRISKLNAQEIGYQKIKSLTENGQSVGYEIDHTILKVQLNEPILPGDSAIFDMKFEAQVPVQIRRSGRDNAEGVDYTMTQWYPKMAEYDDKGWHADPYVAREFYGVFGTYDVNISIDYQYKLGGTGVLQNEEAHWEVARETGDQKFYKLRPSKKEKRDWRFHAENVHDFAWAADKEFIRTSYPGPDGLKLFFLYMPDYKDSWEQLPPHTAEFFSLMNKRFGHYGYSQFSVIQGGDGGMEYPMCTMLKGSGKLKGLIGVMVHESAHNWFYGMLATNETQYPWMDEGFTSFAESEVLNAMQDTPVVNAHLAALAADVYLFTKGQPEPLSTPGDYYSQNKTYGISAYSRGELFLSQLRYILGKEDFNRGMLAYYNRWKFKHPDPWDFTKVMEDVSGIQLDWYLNYWMNTTKTIDYAISGAHAEGRGSAVIELERKGEMPMPLRVMVKTKSNTTQVYYIRLASMLGTPHDMDVLPVVETWPWTSRKYQLHLNLDFADISQIIIDPMHEMGDIDVDNNTWKMEGDQ